jgi:pyridoxine kinase
MQKLGIEVSPIHTVQLSNHTQYDTFAGSFFDASSIQEVVDGMKSNNLLQQHDAVLSGYIGNGDIAKVIANTVSYLKNINKNSIYCCDPVFGDFEDNNLGRIFATQEHPDIFLKHLLPIADIITPNLFELSILSDTKITNYDDISTACNNLLHKTGNYKLTIVITSTSFDKSMTGVAVYENGKLDYLETPKYHVKPKVSGSGDITAAMFLCYKLKGLDNHTALKRIVTTLDNIFKTTRDLNTDELALIQSQEFIK